MNLVGRRQFLRNGSDFAWALNILDILVDDETVSEKMKGKMDDDFCSNLYSVLSERIEEENLIYLKWIILFIKLFSTQY